MSDIMLNAVIQMPYEMAMKDELSRRQFYERANQALDERNTKAAEIERLRQPWISVAERLPEPGVTVFVYSPPQPDDWPDSVRIEFDAIDPESDGESWVNHSAHYEHFCCVAKGGMDVPMTGPSEKAPYTHWMPVPAIPAALSGEPT